MKRLLLMVVLMMSAAMAMGCQNNKSQEVQPVPAPAYEDQAFEPVTVQPAPAMEPAPAPDTAPNAGQYTVQKGDTLWSIAERFYGNGQRYVDIIDANPGIEPKKLREGQTIYLP